MGDLEKRIIFRADDIEHFLAGLLHHARAGIVVLVDAVPEAAEAEGVLRISGSLDELGDAVNRADFHEHLQRGLIRPAMRRTPQAGDARRNAGKGVRARRTGKAHRRGRGVLFVIGMQDKDTVQRASKNRIDLVRLAGHAEHHLKEIRRVIELVARIHEGLADRIFECRRRNRRHFCDHADRCDVALGWIVDVDGVVIEGCKRADRPYHHGHRVCVTAEAGEEPVHLLMDHSVVGDAVHELRILLLVRQLAVKKEVAGFQEAAVLGEFVDRIAAMEKDALVAVDKGNVGFARRRRREARVVGEDSGLAEKGGDIDDIRPDGA